MKLDAELGPAVARCGELRASQASIFTSREHTSLLSLLPRYPLPADPHFLFA